MWAILSGLISKAASSASASLGGIPGWVVSKIMIYGGKYLLDLAKKYFDKWFRGAKQEKAAEKFEEVVKDPNSSVDQRAEEYAKTINTR
jgi:hypothetical protein